MHVMTLVIGEVEPQMEVLKAQGWCDWWAIGGRYTEALVLKPGASGKVYGDAVSEGEAAFTRLHANPDTEVVRMGAGAFVGGSGVDQCGAATWWCSRRWARRSARDGCARCTRRRRCSP